MRYSTIIRQNSAAGSHVRPDKIRIGWWYKTRKDTDSRRPVYAVQFRPQRWSSDATVNIPITKTRSGNAIASFKRLLQILPKYEHVPKSAVGKAS